MKYSDEIKSAVRAIESNITFFASGIRLYYPDKTFEEVKQDITGELVQINIEDAHNRKAGDKRPASSFLTTKNQ